MARQRPSPPRPPPQGKRAVLSGGVLTSRACADWMGFTPAWIRIAIDRGVTVRRRRVKLEAETLTLNGRRLHRIHQDRFREFLTAIGWKRLPRPQ